MVVKIEGKAPFSKFRHGKLLLIIDEWFGNYIRYK